MRWSVLSRVHFQLCIRDKRIVGSFIAKCDSLLDRHMFKQITMSTYKHMNTYMERVNKGDKNIHICF